MTVNDILAEHIEKVRCERHHARNIDLPYLRDEARSQEKKMARC